MKLTAVIVLVVVLCARPGAAETCKRLVEYGWDVPSTAYVREHIAEMEKIPFDGLVMRVDSPDRKRYPREFGWCAWSKIRFNADDWDFAAADLKATKFKRFTDNFLQLTVWPGDVDWFAPEWPNVAHNAGVLARIAKRGGCKGIMLDPEPYGAAIWQYNGFPEEWRKGHTFEEYRARVRECGKTWIRAVNAEYPDITILALYGPYAPLWMSGGHFDRDPAGNTYGLMREFWDGVIEAAAPGTIIVDGFESSYGFKTLKKFQSGRDVILNQSKSLYSDPKKYEKHVRCGFGIWADWKQEGTPFSLTDIDDNYHTPESLRRSLAMALHVSDEYVWVYTEQMRWWNEKNAPLPYIGALALARSCPVQGEEDLQK